MCSRNAAIIQIKKRSIIKNVETPCEKIHIACFFCKTSITNVYRVDFFHKNVKLNFIQLILTITFKCFRLVMLIKTEIFSFFPSQFLNILKTLFRA